MYPWLIPDWQALSQTAQAGRLGHAWLLLGDPGFTREGGWMYTVQFGVWPQALSTALACVRSIVDLAIPNNAGYFRPIEVIAPLGTIANPRPPAA